MHLWDDLRLAFRRLRQQPGFTSVAVITLALGLGANIAIFTLIHGLMLQSLPVARPSELYRLGDSNNCCVNSGLQTSYSLFSTRLFERLREATREEFTEIAGFQATTMPVGVRRAGAGVSASLSGQYVTGNYFAMFGVRPASGRLLQHDDDRADAEPVAVISHRAWTDQFAKDPSVVGGAFVINGRPMTIVGVAAADFFGEAIRANPAGIWIPLGQEQPMRGVTSLADRLSSDWLYAIGRIKPGSSPERIAGRATSALQQWLGAQTFLQDTDRAELPKQHIVVTRASGGVNLVQAQFGQPLTILAVTSVLVLLIASANLANLLLARADRGQAAIRAALGATSGRLMRQALTEGVVLALVGGAAGLIVATGGARALLALAFPGVGFVPVDPTPSPIVLLFGLLLAVFTGLIFTAGPAWAMSRTAPLDALAGVGRGGHHRALVPRRSLVIVQVALSFVLLAGAGLLSTSLTRLEEQPLGFEPDDRVIVRIDPPALAGEPDRLMRLYASLREQLLRAPGVRNASYALYSPMEGNNWSSAISIAGKPPVEGRPESGTWNRVGPGYFETVGTRALRGRLFDDRDTPTARRVAVVNDAFRRRHFENAEVLGQRLGIGDESHAGDFEIVGVVEDVKYTGPTQPVRPMVFLPAFQHVEYADAGERSTQARSGLMRAIVIQAAPGAGALEGAVRRTIGTVDPNLNIIRVLPLLDQVSANFRLQRLMARLTSVYGILALALASLGLYGVTAYGVSQRRREIGVRMALGADRTRIIRTILAGPIVQTSVGLLIGVPSALFASRTIATQLYGIGGQDPTIFGIAVVVLLASAFVAAVFPALRAASISPTAALRG